MMTKKASKNSNKGIWMKTGELKVELDFVFERRDSKFVKWTCIEDDSDYPKNYSSEWADNIGCFETETWPLPGDHSTVEPGDRIHVKGPAIIEFTKSWTDCGYEYDAHITWEDDQMTVEILKAESLPKPAGTTSDTQQTG